MMKHYDSYKDSGIEWIGEIPNHWELKRMKYVTHSLSGYSFKSDDFDINKEVPVIRIGDVSDSIDFESCIKIDSYFLDIKKEFIIYKDDILIGLTGGTIGKSGRYNYSFPSLLNQRVGLVRNTDSLNNSLLYYLVKSNYFSEYIDFNCYGGGQDNISMNDIGDMSLPLPPLSEQEHIVSYLDDKTTKIDELIQKKLRKIDLLKEYRTSLINTVVTKGLNPNVPMKDSGIEWIGEIPSHWEVKRMKYVTHSLSGYSFKSDDFDINKEVPVIRIGDVSDSIDFESCIKIDSYFLDIKKEFIIYKDDILIGLTGGTIGKSGRYNYSFPSLLNQRVGLVRNTDSLNNSLLYYLVKSNYFSEYIDFNCYGGGQDNISMNDIGDMSLPLPPLSEQEHIVSYLDEKTSQIDKTIDIEKKKIELLKEYRQSLISNVVTGKIKVTE